MGIAEAVNETATEAMSILSDFYTMGDDAEYRKYYNERIKNGDSKTQAAFNTAVAMLGQMAQSGLAGGLSGGIMAGGGIAMNNASHMATDSGTYTATNSDSPVMANTNDPIRSIANGSFNGANENAAVNHVQAAPQSTAI